MMKCTRPILMLLLAVVFQCTLSVNAQEPSTKQHRNTPTSAPTGFTYQGQLRDDSGPVNGLFDVRVTLYATQADTQALQSIEQEGLSLANGLLRLSLDFGPLVASDGEAWLEIAVRAHGSVDGYTVLTPRQKLSSTPYAILAQAEPWSLIGVPVGFHGNVAEVLAVDGSASSSVIPENAAAESSTKNTPVLKAASASAEPMGIASPQASQNFIAKFDNRGLAIIDSIMFDNGTNVGIGTTSPGYKLHVTGAAEGVSIQGTSGGASNLAYMTFRDSAGTRIGYVGDGSTGDNNVFLASDNGNVTLNTLAGRVLTATASGIVGILGNVGIGTTSPQRALQIGPGFDAAFTFAPSDASPNAGFIRFGDNTGWKLHIGRSRENSAAAGAPLNNGTTGVLMTIQDNGNIGIGTVNPGFKLDVAGTIRAANVAPSDARLKDNVTPLTNALDKLEQIRGVSFEWNDRAEPLGHARGQKDIGVIAQEVEAVFPELVNTSPTDGYKAVDYSRLTAVLIEAVKELKAEHDALKTENDALRARLNALEQLAQ